MISYPLRFFLILVVGINISLFYNPKLVSLNFDTPPSISGIDATAKRGSLQRNSQNPLFAKLSINQSGIDFANKINETQHFNYLTYPLMLNGGGVAIGDINNDGLSDIFLTGNMVSSRLYLNKGNMEFKDITEKAGVSTDRWITGVSTVDINNDGYLDLYLSVSSPEAMPAEERANLLFVNNGDNTFSEMAKAYNLDHTGHSTHALFLDYNKDGLLDVFLLNHSPGTFLRAMGMREQSVTVSTGYDKLYKNNGDGTFADVSKQAGILNITGFGLGAVSADVNRDGWPDIYVSNDIVPDDQLYINNKDGTFTDRSKEYLKHTSYAGMGVDIADFNNDGWPDVLQVDMTPRDYQERKLSNYAVNFAQYANKIIRGSNYQFNKNALQMNTGLNAEGEVVFSEIARITGVAYTGWSWASLFGDYNNDGKKDILITNGVPKATNDYDYVVESNSSQKKYELYKKLRDVKIPNYFFKNEGGLHFKEVSRQWGFQDSTYSYGAAHGDLDNDGDLDLVINNLNTVASVYQNKSSDLKNDNHYLSVSLKGSEDNRLGIGTEVVLTCGDQKQYKRQTLYRGYQSSQDPRLHFGVSQHAIVDSVEIYWPDGSYQLLTNVKTNQQISIDYSQHNKSTDPGRIINIPENRPFKERPHFQYKHEENKFNDYRIQPLLWRQLSRMGPKLAAGDVNGDGLDDFFAGGASGNPGMLFIQNKDGSFKKSNKGQPWLTDETSEDMGAVFFDANGDGHLDLYVASGGYEISRAEDAILDRLYLNIGSGKFVKNDYALPRLYTSTSQVIPGDFNSDGQVDLFVAGRLVPYKYPFPAKSYILKNNKGKFIDVTEKVAPELVEPGLITDALWTDFNNDGNLDLITAGVWQPVQFYENRGNNLQNVTDAVTEKSPVGWWYSLGKGDFNNDGAIDIIGGNVGLNHTFKTSEEKKFGVYAGDFNSDYTTDVIYTVEEEEGEYPFFGKARFRQGLKFIDEDYSTFEEFSKASVSDIFGTDRLDHVLHYQADTFASTMFANNGDGTFSVESLPEEAQISPIKSIISYDVDKDKNLDLIVGGNLFATHPAISRLDGGNGLWLKGDGSGKFQPVPSYKSGLYAPDDVKDMKLISTANGKVLLIANNDGPVQVFELQ